ncbi:Protein PLANT CADMIUM RESISTANCE 6 [Camellia lanceoleosa]|uniref:Protein PLANT CADMIUM RESISTANCE 6 n=1 Tax=Camellia lanceoleosa TaxID=1840588 RepID=A0ACC0F9D2_9ERIC|nr:Protein PLANT CADMIUM RESISTANCE 6 [Camellia lanceoleosa]
MGRTQGDPSPQSQTPSNPSPPQPQEYHYDQQATDDIPPPPPFEAYTDENHHHHHHEHGGSSDPNVTNNNQNQQHFQPPPPSPPPSQPQPPQAAAQPVRFPPQFPQANNESQPPSYPPKNPQMVAPRTPPRNYPPQGEPVQFPPPPPPSSQAAYHQASASEPVQFPPPPPPSQATYHQASEPVQFPPPPSQATYHQPQQQVQFQQQAQQQQMGAQMAYNVMPPSPMKPTVQMNGVASGFPVNEYPIPQVGTEGWKTGLFDCMDDPLNAIMTVCFPCLTFGQIAEIIDNGHTSCATSGMLYGLIACVIGMPCLISCGYRSKLRSRYGLVESPAPDWITHFFCEHCALCQEYRELQHRGLDPSIGWLGNVARQQQQPQVAMVAPMNQTMMG